MEFIDKILERCETAGAEMADLFNISSSTLSISVRDGNVETIKRATPGGLGIRFFTKGKMAFAHSTDQSESSIDAIIPRLSNMAQKTETDPYAAMPGPQDYNQDLDLYDGSQAGKSLEEKIEYLRILEDLALKYDPIITKSNGVTYEEYVTTRSLGNSKGVRSSYEATLYRVGISVVAAKRGEMYPGEGSMYVRHFNYLPQPHEIVKYFASRAVSLIGGTPVEPGDYEIIFTPESAGSICWGLNSALNGSNSYKGSSFLTGKLGKAVAAESFTVIDDAVRPGGVSSKPADDEGSACQKTILIENGILKNFLYDMKTAAKAKIKSTGSAFREDYSAAPAISYTNFYIAPGKEKLEDVIAACKKGIIVEQTQGWGLQSVTGQYSAGINGILVENGKRIRPVAGVTIAASSEEILNGIGAICDDIQFYWDMTSPSLMVKRMKVGA